MFRLDIDLGSTSGEDQRRTLFLWLCERCAQLAKPAVEVSDQIVRVRLIPLHAAAAQHSFSSVVN